MRRWAAILGIAGAAFALLGYSGLGGAFADLAQMLFFVTAAGFAVVLASLLGRRRRG